MLRTLAEYGLGRVPVYRAASYCPSSRLFLALGGVSPTGSLKDRTGYYLLNDLIERLHGEPLLRIVESTSGNLGISLCYFTKSWDCKVLCVIDPTITRMKRDRLEEAGAEILEVSLVKYPDYRTARIEKARELDRKAGFYWLNQYDNPAGFLAHFETTGPEIWEGTGGQADVIICSVGTGGTICGVGHALKRRNPKIKIIGVEPKGSTIFGGNAATFLNVGAGLRYPSGLVERYGQVIDFYSQVDDRVAVAQCKRFVEAEGVNVGISTGYALHVGAHWARQHPLETVVVISPDMGDNYTSLLLDSTSEEGTSPPEIYPVSSIPGWRKKMEQEEET